MLQIQFKGMTIYDCGTTYNPKHPENNPACTVVTNLKDSLRLQVSCLSFAVVCDLFQNFLAIGAAAPLLNSMHIIHAPRGRKNACTAHVTIC